MRQRLRSEECLPEKGWEKNALSADYRSLSLLETLCRREKDGRQQAEAVVASERRRADLAVATWT
ncbi:unnamed protein product [Cladocopium goreaui]|uniref:Uncharacterized protein n=1 Tax=Cladocopium goreaui TaxID=2562237 RepID=A0A9P1CFJ4_9DINO|nr:unnamed protein product [Cladocopium goreaui]